MRQQPMAFQAKKTLGQNFLQDGNLALKIVRTIAPEPSDSIVEIGPGFGALTKHLVASGCRYCGIEIDERLVPVLQDTFGAYANFSLRHADFRKTDLADFATVNEIYGEFFTDVPPARACVQVAALPKGAAVEIEWIAVAAEA